MKVKNFSNSYMTWKERKKIEGGRKPLKNQRLSLSVARPMMKKQHQREKKMLQEMKKQKQRKKKILQERMILGRFGRKIGGSSSSRKKSVGKHKPEDRGLKLRGRFRNDILDVNHHLLKSTPTRGMTQSFIGLAFMMASCSKLAKENKAKEERTKGSNWLELPREITANILERLDVVDILIGASSVCSLWWKICMDPFMWRTIIMNNICFTSNVMVEICYSAVERSCGQLEDIEIVSFCTDDLLIYIADRGSNLRRIRLTECQYISYNQFSEVANKFPLLEELDISFSNLSEDSLEVIGRCCPHLKSLKFSRMFYTYIKGDDDAFAIAKTMPKLRHLSMSGNLLTNVGLDAILDGCPLLESLDLQNCFHLDLSGSLGKRCRDQIKDLVLPIVIDENCDDEDNDSFYLDSPIENEA
ncbi:unnamed protein product [Trifolium pratense]|uniref:Uncharacterized protein n=1 Tax=Trifolium pratense TaxID=57577 RepID=A0ACB0J9F6_TRIPR|nr:unnamed protein product [Trifolium pratense]